MEELKWNFRSLLSARPKLTIHLNTTCLRRICAAHFKPIMKCLNKVLTIIGCITAAVAVVTAAFAVLNYFKEKKENAELEAYLEGSIQ